VSSPESVSRQSLNIARTCICTKADSRLWGWECPAMGGARDIVRVSIEAWHPQTYHSDELAPTER
jgi:hypothetical protein